ncbi:hypothetical protein [Streptomyces sp. NPDC055733]
MTYHHRDRDGDLLTATPGHDRDGQPTVLIATTSDGVDIPLDRIEELVAGIREAARQAAVAHATATWRVPCSSVTLCQQPHPAHDWEPQPGMTPVHCPGGTT